MKISICGDSLEYLLERLKKEGIQGKDYNKIKFDYDYMGCYYESDTPSMVVEIPDDIIKKTS